MTNQMICPRCGKSITPVERWVVLWEKGILRKNALSWGITGIIGLLLLIIGIILFIIGGISSIGLAGLGTTLLACFILTGLVTRYLKAARSRQRRQVCPLCKYHWIGQSTVEIATAGLEEYFTDVEELRNDFEALVATPTLTRRLLIIHGVGGVGKSSLLRMFRLLCRKQGIAVALSSGDEAKSSIDILFDWAKDLTNQGIDLPTFMRTLNEYRIVQKKVEERSKVEQGSRGDTSKSAIKIAVQTAGGIVGFIPLVGPALSIAMGGASDTLVDWLHGFLNKQEIDLFLDPTDELTQGFLNDLIDAIGQTNRTESTHRIVLLLDTLEQMAALTRWICDLAQRLHPNVLIVLAGRVVPNWQQQWPGWTVHARVEELKPMSVGVMRELVHRYYATQRVGEPDPTQVEAIIQFARGLPIAVTSIVQLWVQYGMEDFQAVRAQVVADLVDQMTRGMPEHVRPVLKAAATLRWFNKELLSVVTGDAFLSDAVYEELRRFPFVRPRKEGLALHDSVREHFDDNLRMHEPTHHREMHQRAASYFETQLQTLKGEVATDLALEALYHKMMADEEQGIKQYRKGAEELVSYQLLNQLRTLLNDVNNYPLQKENSRLWREYYRARLRDLEGRHADAVSIYQMIADNEHAEEILRAYALCDWAWITSKANRNQTGEILERIQALFPEPDILPELDAKLGFYLLQMGGYYKEEGRWNDAITYFERAHKLFERMGDLYWLAFTYNQKKYYYLDRGMWKEALEMQKSGLAEVVKLTGEKQQSYLEAEIIGGVSIGWMWAGKYRKTEENLRKSLRIAEQFERAQQRSYFLRDLALVLGLQGKVQEATQRFKEAIELGRQQDPLFEAVSQGFQGMIALKWVGAEEAEHYLTSSMHGFGQQTRKWQLLYFLHCAGTLHELKKNPDLAERAYHECLDLHNLEQWYWNAGALTGLVRVYYAKEDYDALTSALQEAESLAQQYEYNDHLASLRLIQGHLAWDVQESGKEQRFETALNFYKQALLHALRYNRFLLDEVLSGRSYEPLLPPIIPYCLKHGVEGRRMLQGLRGWWQSELNDPGSSRSGSISQSPPGITLLEAEHLVRLEEPGDGTPQLMVLEQLDKSC